MISSGSLPTVHNDAVKAAQSLYQTFNAATSSATLNPAADMTRVNVENPSLAFALAITINGTVAGAAAVLGTVIVRPNQTKLIDFDDFTSIDNTQVPIDSITARTVLMATIPNNTPLSATVPATAVPTAVQAFQASFDFSNA